MKNGSISISYKIFLISTSLFVLSFVANVFKFLFNDVTYHILYRVVPVSVLIAGFISLFGLYLAFRGSKGDSVNVKIQKHGIVWEFDLCGVCAGCNGVRLFSDTESNLNMSISK